MKRSTFCPAIMVLILIMSIPVSAKITSPYCYFSAGACRLAKEIQIPGLHNLWKVQTDTQAGFYLAGGGGCSIGSHIRLEFDVDCRRISIADLEIVEMNVIGISIERGEGNIKSLSFLLNGWYDLNLGGRWAVYFGGGFGAGLTSLKDVYIETAPVVPNPVVTKTLYVKDGDWRFALQAGAGITYALSDDFKLDLGYRYYATADPRFKTERGDEFSADMPVHTASISLKFIF